MRRSQERTNMYVPQTEYDLRTERVAGNSLRAVTEEARSAGVPSKALHVRHRDAHVAILDRDCAALALLRPRDLVSLDAP
jgi:hypothetical protein